MQLILPGLAAEQYEAINDELEAFLAQQAQRKGEQAESGAALAAAQLEAVKNPPPAPGEPGATDPAEGQPPAAAGEPAVTEKGKGKPAYTGS